MSCFCGMLFADYTLNIAVNLLYAVPFHKPVFGDLAGKSEVFSGYRLCTLKEKTGLMQKGQPSAEAFFLLCLAGFRPYMAFLLNLGDFSGSLYPVSKVVIYELEICLRPQSVLWVDTD